MNGNSVLEDHDATKQPWFSLIKADLKRFFELDCNDPDPGMLDKLSVLLSTPGLHAILVYRFGAWVTTAIKIPIVKQLFKLTYFFLDKLCIIFWGIHIDRNAQIGPGLYIGHYGGIMIGAVKMGKDCNVSHGVTIGRRAGGDPRVPTIGNNVWIGPSSILFGGITIGDGATIGPLTVVGRNLPARTLVIGNPMRLLRKNYDNSKEIYGSRNIPSPRETENSDADIDLTSQP